VKVFVSWSGQRSKIAASALAQWIPEVLQDVDTWMSDHDVSAGARWAAELGVQLAEAHYGILCLTPENIDAPWLMFEAGALSKIIDSARVVPYLIGLRPTDVTYPLAQFQNVVSDRNGTFKLILGMNSVRPTPMSTERLEKVFDKWWHDLELQLSAMDASSSDDNRRSERDILEEILSQVRALGKDTAAVAGMLSPQPKTPTPKSLEKWLKTTWDLTQRGPNGEDYVVRCPNCGHEESFDPRFGERPPQNCPKCQTENGPS